MEKLKTVEAKFNEKIVDANASEALQLMEKYYKWVFNNGEKQEGEARLAYENAFNQLLYKIAHYVHTKNIKCKELSSGWNPYMVAQVYELSNAKRNKTLSIEEYNKKLHLVFQRLLDEEDFATKAYCINVLQDDGVINFASLNAKEEPKEKRKGILRPGYLDSMPQVLDVGISYWHTLQKKLMTYDECTEKGFDHRFLAYPRGHELELCYVGFDEPVDANKLPIKELRKIRHRDFVDSMVDGTAIEVLDGEKMLQEETAEATVV